MSMVSTNEIQIPYDKHHKVSSLVKSYLDTGGWGGGGLLGSIFAGYVPLASQSPYPIIVYSVANYRLHLSHFWANMSFLRSQLSLFIFMYVPYIE